MTEQFLPPAPDSAEQEIAVAIELLRRGAPDGMQQIIPLVYAELRRIAHRQLSDEPMGHTLSTTALVHEAYLRLTDQSHVDWENRAQFLGLAARAMRRVLVDHARRHHAARRGGPRQQRLSLDTAERAVDTDVLTVATRADELLALDEALDRLAVVDPRLARVVECRFFGGLTETETAAARSPRPVASSSSSANGVPVNRFAAS